MERISPGLHPATVLSLVANLLSNPALKYTNIWTFIISFFGRGDDDFLSGLL